MIGVVNLDGSITVRRDDPAPPIGARSVRAIAVNAFAAVDVADGGTADSVNAAPTELFAYNVEVAVDRVWLTPWRRRVLERAARNAALAKAPTLSTVNVTVIEAWRVRWRQRRARRT